MREVAVESTKLGMNHCSFLGIIRIYLFDHTGVTVSKTWRDSATHFITPSINMSRRALHSLMLGISLVDIKWLEELFRRGNELSIETGPDERGIVALESHFVLPNEQEFRPQLASSEEEEEDITGWPIELWDANPGRKSIWNGLQFHFFCDETVSSYSLCSCELALMWPRFPRNGQIKFSWGEAPSSRITLIPSLQAKQ
jgi:hypothetical protein